MFNLLNRWEGGCVQQTILYSEALIRDRVRALAVEISQDYRGKPIVLVGLLNGCYLFLPDLSREIEKIRQAGDGVSACYIDFMRVSSYEHQKESLGRVNIEMDVQKSPEGKHVIVVDEVAETLTTTAFVQGHLQAKRPTSIEMCVLIAKPDRHKKDIPLKYVGFSRNGLPFLKGYGMDNQEGERGLPFIAECV